VKVSPKLLLRIYKTLRAKYGHLKWWPGDTRFEIILGAILTQNTSWTNVEKAITVLKKRGVLKVEAIHHLPEGELAGLIRSAGYFNIKANRIKNFTHYLYQIHNGSLSKMFLRPGKLLREELLAIKGIGPETADSILLYAGRKPFFVVDAYTKRVFSRHKFFRQTSPYEQVQAFFMTRLTPDTPLYNDYHAQIVNLAKRHCFKKNPDCKSCPLRFLFSLPA